MTTNKTLAEEAEAYKKNFDTLFKEECPHAKDTFKIDHDAFLYALYSAYIAGAKRGHEKGWEDKDAITRKAVTLYEDEIVPRFATQADAMKEWEDGK